MRSGHLDGRAAQLDWHVAAYKLRPAWQLTSGKRPPPDELAHMRR